MAKPRFHFISTLGVSAPGDQARKVLVDGLGLREIAGDASYARFVGAKTAVYVDTQGNALPGFTPLFGTDDLQAATNHLQDLGCQVRPLPWAAQGRIVEGPEGLRFCIAQTAVAQGWVASDESSASTSPHVIGNRAEFEASNAALALPTRQPPSDDLEQTRAIDPSRPAAIHGGAALPQRRPHSKDLDPTRVVAVLDTPTVHSEKTVMGGPPPQVGRGEGTGVAAFDAPSNGPSADAVAQLLADDGEETAVDDVATKRALPNSNEVATVFNGNGEADND